MKKIGSWLATLLVWASIVVLVIWVWDTKLIAIPQLFYPALGGLIMFSAVFSSAETAFTILQEDMILVNKNRENGLSMTNKLDSWLERNKTSRYVAKRYNLVNKNIEEAGFQTLLPFLLVMNNLINLSGMYFIGRGLVGGASSDKLSLVMSAVVVVIFGEVVAKCVALRLPAATASWTVLIIGFLKPVLSWYTSRLVSPIEAILDSVLAKSS